MVGAGGHYSLPQSPRANVRGMRRLESRKHDTAKGDGSGN